jgi:hypothetical protein
MGRIVISLFATLSSVNAACSFSSLDAPLHERVRIAAQDLRWTKGAESRATVPLKEFDRPVVVLVLPPGQYRASDLETLVDQTQARQFIRHWIRNQTLNVARPSISVFQPGRSESAYFDQLSVPQPIAVWKQDDGPLDVLLHRVKDDVQITAIR